MRPWLLLLASCRVVAPPVDPYPPYPPTDLAESLGEPSPYDAGLLSEDAADEALGAVASEPVQTGDAAFPMPEVSDCQKACDALRRLNCPEGMGPNCETARRRAEQNRVERVVCLSQICPALTCRMTMAVRHVPEVWALGLRCMGGREVDASTERDAH